MLILLLMIWLPLFFISYLCMRWRQQVLNLEYSRYELDPALLASLIVPPFAIIFALAEVAAFKLGVRQKGEKAI